MLCSAFASKWVWNTGIVAFSFQLNPFPGANLNGSNESDEHGMDHRHCSSHTHTRSVLHRLGDSAMLLFSLALLD